MDVSALTIASAGLASEEGGFAVPGAILAGDAFAKLISGLGSVPAPDPADPEIVLKPAAAAAPQAAEPELPVVDPAVLLTGNPTAAAPAKSAKAEAPAAKHSETDDRTPDEPPTPASLGLPPLLAALVAPTLAQAAPGRSPIAPAPAAELSAVPVGAATKTAAPAAPGPVLQTPAATLAAGPDAPAAAGSPVARAGERSVSGQSLALDDAATPLRSGAEATPVQAKALPTAATISPAASELAETAPTAVTQGVQPPVQGRRAVASPLRDGAEVRAAAASLPAAAAISQSPQAAPVVQRLAAGGDTPRSAMSSGPRLADLDAPLNAGAVAPMPAARPDANSALLPIPLVAPVDGGVAAPVAAIQSPAPAAVPAPAELAIERQLDVARDGAWLDQLASDIVRTSGSDASLRFRLNPETLGTLHVEVSHGRDGASVRLTADTEQARTLIADARPQLVTEARAQGVRIAEAHVDLSGQGQSQSHAQAGNGGRDGREASSREYLTSWQPESAEEEATPSRRSTAERYA